MARSAVDCGAMLSVIAGQDPKDTTSVPLPVPDYLAGLSGDLRGVTIGIDRRWTSEGTDDVAGKVLAEGAPRRGRSRCEDQGDQFPRPEGRDRRLVPALRHRGRRRA